MQKVTILGCGVVGAAIAYELSRQPDFQITVIDRNMPAQGSTGAALGVLMGVVSSKTKGRAWQLRQTSLQRYETLIPELEAMTGLRIPYNRQGLVLLATSLGDMEKWAILAEVRKNQGWDLNLWQPETLGQRCPQINLEEEEVLAENSRNPHPSPLPERERGQEKSASWGAVYSPGDRQIDPVALTTTLVAAAQKNGVEFHFGVNPALYGARDLSPLSVLQELETGDADWLILATGLGTTELTKTIGTPVDIRPVLGQAIQIEMPYILGDPTFQPVISRNDIHVVPLANHHYWIGATVEFADAQGLVSAQTELLETLRKEAIKFCPGLAEGKIVKTWSGLRPRPEGQAAPIIKKLPNHNQIILATGHYRNGVLLAPATAIAVQELLHS